MSEKLNFTDILLPIYAPASYTWVHLIRERDFMVVIIIVKVSMTTENALLNPLKF